MIPVNSKEKMKIGVCSSLIAAAFGVFAFGVFAVSDRADALSTVNYQLSYKNDYGLENTKDIQIIQTYKNDTVAVDVEGSGYSLYGDDVLNIFSAGVETVLSGTSSEINKVGEVICSD